jgi:hypothetical protein
METLEEFKKRILNQPRKYKVNNSLGVYDGYKYYRKNKPDNKQFILSESQYFAIIRKINLHLVDELLLGNDVKLPKSMGTIEIRKRERKVKLGSDGKVVTNLPIDWDKTLKLWYEDEESYNNKTLIRVDEKEIFKIYYNKNLAKYTNVCYYEFLFNKDLKIRLKQKIKEGKIEAHCFGKRLKYD